MKLVSARPQASKGIVFAAYGGDRFYHYGALFAALRAGVGMPAGKAADVCVYTDQPEIFRGYPFVTVALDSPTLDSHTLGGTYHFRIKNRVMSHALSNGWEKVIFCDSDLLFCDDLELEFQRITPSNALMYRDEGPARSRCRSYDDVPHYAPTQIGDMKVALSGRERMWGSAVMGLHRSMQRDVDDADQIIVALAGNLVVHTLEQYALSVVLAQRHTLNRPMCRIIDFSDAHSKAIAKQRIHRFFQSYHSAPYEEQVAAAKNWRVIFPLERWLHKRLGRRAESYKNPTFDVFS